MNKAGGENTTRSGLPYIDEYGIGDPFKGSAGDPWVQLG
jgi:hypothetical protein